ncbi:hypothetical protein [Streptomyces flaveolus]|uniref:hypothetical protein n=1 Tax=Streptomyces flaveolus TaxID=67297 RepID=UPI0036FD823E
MRQCAAPLRRARVRRVAVPHVEAPRILAARDELEAIGAAEADVERCFASSLDFVRSRAG